ncbi:MAG: molecular chaperone HtpG [Spirochaetaceae bacterium]
MSRHEFQTEVNQLLHLIIHSLYSNSEIFLRELVSNASDALDKLKYLTLTDDAFKSLSFDPRIDISFDEKDKKTITISDTGIGMDEADLVEQLGTIARSGTKSFLAQLSGDAKKDSNLIGQFGVGFYSAFMVAEKVDVLTKKAGTEMAYLWSSDGKGSYEVQEATREGHGTTVTLHLMEDGKEYASRWRLEGIIKKYSNHVAFPIYLHFPKIEYDDKGHEISRSDAVEQINSASAMWRKPKSDLTEEDYVTFYKNLGHDTEEPLTYLHTRAEGTLDYTTLFYVPKKAPFDMYQVDYQPGVRLYVKRVFITDDAKELMPAYLRFLRGVIDSEDLPLNVSREILQENRVLASIRSQSVKKVLNEFSRLAQEEPEKFQIFVEQFNRPMKEGLYTDYGNRETLLELVRFKSTKVDGYTSLADYKERMLPDQKAIYYVTGDNIEALRKSPLLEAYRKKDIEVLLMDDEVDEIVVPTIGSYKETDLKPINRSDAGEDLKDDAAGDKAEHIKPILTKIKAVLKDRVKDVVASVRLSDSPSCIVLDESDPSLKIQELLKSMGQADIPEVKPILEVNPEHAIIRRLGEVDDTALVEDLSILLLEEAMMAENVPLKDPTDFVARLNRVMERAL